MATGTQGEQKDDGWRQANDPHLMQAWLLREGNKRLFRCGHGKETLKDAYYMFLEVDMKNNMVRARIRCNSNHCKRGQNPQLMLEQAIDQVLAIPLARATDMWLSMINDKLEKKHLPHYNIARRLEPGQNVDDVVPPQSRSASANHEQEARAPLLPPSSPPAPFENTSTTTRYREPQADRAAQETREVPRPSFAARSGRGRAMSLVRRGAEREALASAAPPPAASSPPATSPPPTARPPPVLTRPLPPTQPRPAAAVQTRPNAARPPPPTQPRPAAAVQTRPNAARPPPPTQPRPAAAVQTRPNAAPPPVAAPAPAAQRVRRNDVQSAPNQDAIADGQRALIMRRALRITDDRLEQQTARLALAERQLHTPRTGAKRAADIWEAQLRWRQNRDLD